jgi:pimeloyl-ACP methyl ester carboxylesterase
MTPEVIDKGTTTEAHPVPLLFVHGAFHGAWCWDEHFLPFFAGRGYRALALNLRGHGSSPLTQELNQCSVADYVEDVATVAAGLPVPPVVIGHSMGGFVVQKYLAEHAAPAGVLLASAPPRGLVPAMRRVARRNARHSGRPAALRRPLLFFGHPAVARATFFNPHTPEHVVARCTQQLGDESTRVLYRDLVYADLAEPARVRAPMLVLGAEEDGFFARRQTLAIGRAYRTRTQMFPAMGHNMMLEPGWPDVAAAMDTWLRRIGL